MERKRSSGSLKANILGDSTQKNIDLDYVLVNEIGQFGRFQLLYTVLAVIPIFFSAALMEYIFGAAAIPHRCQISECAEDSKLMETFEPAWLMNAIPASTSGNNDFDSCRRFQSSGNGTLDYCPVDIFNQNVQVNCDAFVYARTESVVYEFDLGCREWIRALAGTLSSVGTLLALPITGNISDHFGRRVSLIFNVFNMGLFGFIRAFSVNYPMYLALQILQTTFGSGTFCSAYIFATEFVGPKWRVLISSISTSMFAAGTVLLGAIAWSVDSWYLLLIIINTPCFLIISYNWIISESVRWLLSKEKFEEAKLVLEKVARVNGKHISEKSMEALMTPAPVSVHSSIKDNDSLRVILKSRVLRRRVLTTPVWWITTTFVYYGLSINSTSLSDQRHLNFMLTAAVEIPGNFSCILLLDRIGRKTTLSGGFFLTAVCCFAFAFVSADLAVVRLVLSLLGKFGISVVFTALYLYTAELYPTPYRHRLLAFSSMIGRIGSITAPLTPLLADYWMSLPAILFGIMGLISGVLALTQPETLGTKMPDTLAEAEALGIPSK